MGQISDADIPSENEALAAVDEKNSRAQEIIDAGRTVNKCGHSTAIEPWLFKELVSLAISCVSSRLNGDESPSVMFEKQVSALTEQYIIIASRLVPAQPCRGS